MRGKKLVQNTVSSLVFQISTIICGFVLPRLILQNYGSEVNGLVNSITQFLSVISFLELGVGAVVQSSLYKPLAEKNNIAVSKIVTSADCFFKRLAVILLIYMIALVFIYPNVTHQDYSFFYSGALIVAIGISSFAQYYFGIVNRLLLTSDQRGYISYIAQTITLVLSTIVCYSLMRMGTSIQIVKVAASLIYLFRPVVLSWYVKRNYTLDRKIKYSREPIQQKWNGVSQHVAAVVLDGTDLIVLTLFTNLSTVSIYSVYHLVILGVKQLFLSMTNGIQALLGELWAKQELDQLKSLFSWTEWVIHTATTYVFGCTALLIVPFVQVYTKGIQDANYIQPLFAFLITAAHAGHSLRLPYNLMILAGGHYKQTQNYYIAAAIINITVSVAMVRAFGLLGVAIGTLSAMMFHTIWMAIYLSKNLINWPLRSFCKQFGTNIVTVALMYISVRWIHLEVVTYLSWAVMSIQVCLVAAVVVILTNVVFYPNKTQELLKKLKL